MFIVEEDIFVDPIRIESSRAHCSLRWAVIDIAFCDYDEKEKKQKHHTPSKFMCACATKKQAEHIANCLNYMGCYPLHYVGVNEGALEEYKLLEHARSIETIAAWKENT